MSLERVFNKSGSCRELSLKPAQQRLFVGSLGECGRYRAFVTPSLPIRFLKIHEVSGWHGNSD
jgi:hypothetical protein